MQKKKDFQPGNEKGRDQNGGLSPSTVQQVGSGKNERQQRWNESLDYRGDESDEGSPRAKSIE